jgi:hypothetical protein
MPTLRPVTVAVYGLGVMLPSARAAPASIEPDDQSPKPVSIASTLVEESDTDHGKR